MGNSGGSNQPPAKFFPVGIQVDAAGLQIRIGARIQYVNIEDIGHVRFRFEPVNVVFVVGYTGKFPGRKTAVDGWLYDDVVGFIFQSVVVPSMQVATKNQKCRRHIIMPVWHHRATLFQSKDLLSKDKVSRNSINIRKLKLQTLRAIIGHFDVFGQSVKIDKMQQILKIDLRKQIFHLLLPDNL